MAVRAQERRAERGGRGDRKAQHRGHPHRACRARLDSPMRGRGGLTSASGPPWRGPSPMPSRRAWRLAWRRSSSLRAWWFPFLDARLARSVNPRNYMQAAAKRTSPRTFIAAHFGRHRLHARSDEGIDGSITGEGVSARDCGPLPPDPLPARRGERVETVRLRGVASRRAQRHGATKNGAESYRSNHAPLVRTRMWRQLPGGHEESLGGGIVGSGGHTETIWTVVVNRPSAPTVTRPSTRASIVTMTGETVMSYSPAGSPSPTTSTMSPAPGACGVIRRRKPPFPRPTMNDLSPSQSAIE